MNKWLNRHLEQRLRALEKRTSSELNAKRALPDWLQASFEQNGWKFDDYGTVLFSLRPAYVEPDAKPESNPDGCRHRASVTSAVITREEIATDNGK